MAIPDPKGEPALFLVGVLAADRPALDLAGRRLARAFGEPDMAMTARVFRHTDYYTEELGPAPLRTFLAFPGIFPTCRLAERKLLSNQLEIELADELDGPLPRPVNLDPGYLTLAKLVLASAKNFAHRIHLSRGIYAEVTLVYGAKAFRPLPWTFPDYASGEYFPFLLDLRRRIPR